jgi:hypothetical protein
VNLIDALKALLERQHCNQTILQGKARLQARSKEEGGLIGLTRRGINIRRDAQIGRSWCCHILDGCGHLAKLIPDEWPDEAQLADLRQRFVCQSCGHKGRRYRTGF